MIIGKKMVSLSVYAAALALAWALKHHYSTADPSALFWMMKPLSFLVGSLTGIDFAWERGVGYVSPEARIAIVKSCAGINFMIALFCMIVFTRAQRVHGAWKKTMCIPRALFVSWLTALAANTVRIVLVLVFMRAGIEPGWIGAARFHEAQGITVYFFFMMISFYAMERRSAAASGRREEVLA